MLVPMYKLTRKGSFVGCIKQADVGQPHGETPVRLRYELALMVGSPLAKSILRGHVTQYSDGSYSISPRNSKGYATDPRGNLITYWVTPYTFDTEA